VKEKRGQENEKEKIITGFNGEVSSLIPLNPALPTLTF
jgi:hypothetical protein